MMSAQTTAQQYQRAQVGTVDRGRLLLLMYEGAEKFLALAEQGLRDDDVAKFATYQARAQAVIAELMHTLDHEKGGEIAQNLERLYRFMLDELVEASLQKDPARLGQVRGTLGTIAGAYRDILQGGGLQKQNAA